MYAENPEQLQLFQFTPQVTEDFTPDDWETPDELAKFIAELTKPSDKIVLDAGAGRGQITQFIQPKKGRVIQAIEIKKGRFHEGRLRCPHAEWFNQDFLTLEPYHSIDLITSNPPFSLGMNFIDRGLRWLNEDNPEARLQFILPLDYFCTEGRGKMLGYLNCHFHEVMPIIGRVGFIREGKQEKRRQCYDAIFDIRLGQKPSGFNPIWI